MAIGYQEVEHLDTVPSGYIGIYDEDGLKSIPSDPSANYILMNDIDLNVELKSNDGIGVSYNLDSWDLVDNIVPYGVEIELIAFVGGKFIIRTRTDYKVYVSSDGLNWQRSSNSSLPIKYVVYGNGIWLGCTGGSTPRFYSSTNALDWQQVSTISSGFYIYGLAFGNGVFVATGRLAKLYTSPDGVTWTERSSGFPEKDLNDTINQLYIGFDDTMGMFVTCGLVSVGMGIGKSFDGVTWSVTQVTQFPETGTSTLMRLAFGGGMVVFYHRYPGSKYYLSSADESGVIVSSLDCTLLNFETTAAWLRFEGGYFILGSSSFSDGRYIMVADGWAQKTFAAGCNGIAYGNGKYVAVKKVELPDGWENLGEFYGIFDGNGYAIKGMAGQAGLFVYLSNDSEIRNLKIIDAELYGRGAIASGENKGTIDNCYISGGYCFIADYNTGNIINCTADIDIKETEKYVNVGSYAPISPNVSGGLVENCCSHGSIYSPYSDTKFGGFVSGVYGGVIRNCYSSVDIVTGGEAGGFIYQNYSDNVLENCYSAGDINAKGNAAGFIAYNYSYDGFVKNCYYTGNVTSENGDAGGFVYALMGRIENCYSIGNVIGGNEAGGFVTRNNGDMDIKNCYSVGDVRGGRYAGGFIGIYNSPGPIENCYSIGNVIGGNEAGGFTSRCNTNIDIKKCYSSGSVQGKEYVSGFIGAFNGGIIEDCYAIGSAILESQPSPGFFLIGGFAGAYFSPGTLKNCYSAVEIIYDPEDESIYAGGLLGFPYEAFESMGGIITSCYFDSDVSGMPFDNKGEPKTTIEMKIQNTFIGWDFKKIWGINELINDGYPHLQVISPIKAYGINYQLVFGPTTLGINQREKRVRKIYLIVSKPEYSLMLLSYSTSINGPYTDDIPIGGNNALSRAEISIPVITGNPSGGYIYRIRVRGIGKVTIHEIAVSMSARRGRSRKDA